jgi:UDP-N-acetylglucosamine 1-carboxyvinyltransferase
MSKFVIIGNKPLSGELAVSGAKNAVLPLMAACLLTDGKCRLTNVPDIEDVHAMINIMADLGAEIEFSNHVLNINCRNVIKFKPNPELVLRLRGSVLFLGPLLARFGKVEMPFPGGDIIGARSIDTHLDAFRALGGKVDLSNCVSINAHKLTSARIILEESSVTGTENIMMAATGAEGKTVIKLAAMEPHVEQLGDFLKKMGAQILGQGTPTIEITGVHKLHGAEIEVIPDSNEAAGYITLGAAARADIKITHTNPEHLDDFLLKLSKMNVNFEVGQDFVHVKKPAFAYKGTKIQCGLYPKLNSDYVPPMAVLATQAEGETIIYEWLYENRLGHIPELVKMGATAEVLDPHRVRITGPTPLHAQKIKTFDIRMGMTLVIAALIAEGESEISDIHHIDRGYEKLEEKLIGIGASIKRIE